MTRIDAVRALSALAIGLAVAAQGQERVGPEFFVNSYTVGDQGYPVVAADAAGNFVVAWTGDDQDGSGAGVFAQRFDISATPLGSEFQVNSYTGGAQALSSVAADPAGGFVVVWTDEAKDGSLEGVFAQRYDSLGVPVGDEFQVSSYTLSIEARAVAGVDAGGNFVVAWDSAADGSDYGVFGKRYDSAGVPLSADFQVTTFTVNHQRFARLGVTDAGDFLVTWHQTGCSGTCSQVVGQRFDAGGSRIGTEALLTPSLAMVPASLAIDRDTGAFVLAYGPPVTLLRARRFAAAGTPLGSEFQVNIPNGPFSDPGPQAVAVSGGGDFVFTWTDCDSSQDGSMCGVFGRIYASNGAPLGSQFQVSTYTAYSQTGSDVAWLDDDEFVALWTDEGRDACGPLSNHSVFAQRYASSGAPLGSEFQVSTYPGVAQLVNAVAADPAGGFVVAWDSQDQDGHLTGVFARRFDGTGTALGGEFRVSTATAYEQRDPVAAVGPDGGFTVAWTGAAGPTHLDAQAQRYSSAGAPVGTEYRVNVFTPLDQLPSGIGFDAAGNSVIVWSDFDTYQGDGLVHGHDGNGSGVFGRRYDSTGAALGGQFQVNTFTIGYQLGGAVAVRDDGGFITVWSDGDGAGFGVTGQRWDSGGARVGTEFFANTYVTGDQADASVGIDATGNFVVVWDSGGYFSGFNNQDGHRRGVFGQRFSSTGAPLGTEFQVNSFTFDNQDGSDLAVAGSGEFIVTWHSFAQDGDERGIFAQRFSSTGARLGSEYQVNTYTVDDQFEPRIGIDAAGDFVIGWNSFNQECGPGGFSKHIVGQRFRIPTPPPPTATPTPTATFTPTLTPVPAVCAATPLAGCATPGKAVIKLQNKNGTKKLLWKWTNGTVAGGVFGNPVTGSTSYRLCVYDASGLIMSPLVSADGAWQATATGFKYKQPATNPHGVFKVLLKSGTGNAKLLLKAKGPNLTVPLPVMQSPDVTAQLVKDVPSGPECWHAVFSLPNGGSDGEKFKDKLP